MQKDITHEENVLGPQEKEESYVLMCIEKGLGNNEVRSEVWCDLVLGVDKQLYMPHVEKSIVQQHTCSQGSSSISKNSISAVSADTLKPSGGTTSEEEKEDVDEEDKVCSTTGGGDTRKLPANCPSRVIQADVQRSLWTLYPDSSTREAKRAVLKEILLRVLESCTDRHYYQGLHELIGFIMYVMDENSTDIVVAVCSRLLQVQWKSFSDQKLKQTQSMLYAVHVVLAEEDMELATALESCGVAPESHYAVGWLITWYAHICEDTGVLSRLFDFFLAHKDENTIVFFTAALLLHERDHIMKFIREAYVSAEKDDDDLIVMARVYVQLTRLPKDVLASANTASIENMLRHSASLREQHALCVKRAREEFLRGNVTKLGMLEDKRTRNSALKLLWSFLFREWRKPWRDRSVSIPRIVAVFVVVVAVLLGSTTLSSIQGFLRARIPFMV